MMASLVQDESIQVDTGIGTMNHDNANPAEHTPDYEVVRRVIELISTQWREQPSLEELASGVGMPASQLQKVFTRWAGLSPKAFLQAVTLDHARRLLAGGMPLLEASMELGLSGPGRLHDLFVTHEAMSPGAYKSRGEGLAITYGFHETPFGTGLFMVTDRGLAGLAFCDAGDEAACLADMASRWPMAELTEDPNVTSAYAQRAFGAPQAEGSEPMRIVLIGTDFEIRVWEGLTQIPMGRAASYSELARQIGKPKAARAVGAAVGRNPISFVVPCHRVVGSNGALTGYHWGLTRKRAMLGWEAGQIAS